MPKHKNLPKILLVDDSHTHITVLRRILEDMKIEIHEASDGYTAIEHTLVHDYALVLLDVEMPEIDGYEVAEIIHRTPETRHTPIIFVTANATEEISALKGYESGAVDYITKPVNPVILHSKTRIFVDMHRQKERLHSLNRELEAATEMAEAANRAKSSFLANMRHEIRTPLDSIIGTTELLQKTELSDSQKQYVNIVTKSGERLLDIINNVLDMSKIEAGELELHNESVVLKELVKDVIYPLTVKAAEKNIELAVSHAPGTPYAVYLDPLRIKQILTNLIENAIKFVDGGHIIIHLEKEDGQDDQTILRFAVEDNGIGIPKEQLEHVFGKFSQADSPASEKYGGTGLGLAICKQLVQGMGGTLGVESDTGKGALFWFEIPVKVHQPAVVPEQNERMEALFSKRILVVDDSKISRDILGFGFNIWGLEHTLVASGKEALTVLSTAHDEGNPYDIALIDYEMPEMNGEELVQTIRANTDLCQTKLILITTLGKYGGFDSLKASGFDDYILKPIYPEDLMEVLLHISETPSNASIDDNDERYYA